MNRMHQKLFLLGIISFSSIAHLNAGTCGDFLDGLIGAILIAGREQERAERKELERLKQQQEDDRRRLEQLQKNPANTINPKEKMKLDLHASLDNRLKQVTDIDQQSDTDKLALWKKKQEIVENAMKQGFSSFHFAEKYALDSLPGGILEVLRTKAKTLAEKKQSNNDFLKLIDKTVTEAVAGTLSNGGSVGGLFKQLENNIESSRAHYFNQRPQSQPAQRPAATFTPAPQPQTPSLYPDIGQVQAELDPNNVQEIFPRNDTSKNLEEFKNKTRDKKIYPLDNCAYSCFEKFSDLKKRVTLRCGHQMCPQCLYNWIFTKNRQKQTPTCPECRHPIEEKDFNADYVSSKL